jgi:hypothetical protein
MRSLVMIAIGLAPAVVGAAPTLERYGTFNAMGVLIEIAPADDPDQNALAVVEYRVAGSGAYRPGFPLVRVGLTRFTGSLFWLAPGTSYDLRVGFVDPGGALDGASVEASAATRAEIVVPAPSLSHYVSPSGSGTQCTLAQPCALATGISRAQAGEAVVLLDGTYYAGEIDLPRSGAAGAPIVIRSQPGASAVLDGADPTEFVWTPQGGGVYRATVNLPDPHLVVANGQRLMPYVSLTDLQTLVWGVPGCYASGTSLYVRLAGDADPNAAAMAISRMNYAFFVEQSFIDFVDLTFRHYGRGSYAKAIYFFDGSDNLVSGCAFEINDLGIGIKYDAHRNVIQDSVFFDTIFDWPWDAFYAGIDLCSGGIRFYDPATGRGNVIRRNVFHDLFDGFGACPSNTAAVSNETDVYENLVYNAGDDGMESDGQCSNLRIWSNTLHDVLMGISLAPVYTGPVYALRNLIYRTGAGNNDYTGSPFKFNSGFDPSGPMLLFHNTADAALPGNNGLYIKAPGEWSMIIARNNVWAGTAYALENYNTTEPVDLDYDDLYTSGAGALVRWDGINYSTLADFSAATRQEANGFNADPAFVDPAAGDYTLGGTSVLIDAGVPLPGINDGFLGAAPDLGAFEAVPDGPLLVCGAASGGGSRLRRYLLQP